MKTTRTPDDVLALIREQRPDSDPVAAEHDDMACFCQGEPWFVWFGSVDSEPERIIFDRA